MLITDRHLVHFSLVWSTLVHFGQFSSNFVYFGLIQFNQVHLVYFGQFRPIWSILSIKFVCYTSVNSVIFSPFGLIRPIQSTLIYSVHLGIFGPIWSIRSSQVNWSNLVYSVHLGLSVQFGQFKITSVQFGVPT